MISTRKCNPKLVNRVPSFKDVSPFKDETEVVPAVSRPKKFNPFSYFPIKVEKSEHRYTELGSDL